MTLVCESVTAPSYDVGRQLTYPKHIRRDGKRRQLEKTQYLGGRSEQRGGSEMFAQARAFSSTSVYCTTEWYGVFGTTYKNQCGYGFGGPSLEPTETHR